MVNELSVHAYMMRFFNNQISVQDANSMYVFLPKNEGSLNPALKKIPIQTTHFDLFVKEQK